jgi:hypothetical protein
MIIYPLYYYVNIFKYLFYIDFYKTYFIIVNLIEQKSLQ